MIQAEEFGITAANVEQIKAESKNPDVQRFLGVIEEKGTELGLPNDFAVQIITQVGNYGESFDRNVGPSTPLKIERGLNALWTDGGLMYSHAVQVMRQRAGSAIAPRPPSLIETSRQPERQRPKRP